MQIFAKPSLNGLGLMTGTSCDGIDLAHVEFSGTSAPTMVLKKFQTLPYPAEIKIFIDNLIVNKVHISEISKFNFYLAKVFHKAIVKFIGSESEIEKIDFIAVHGQTLWHAPSPVEMFGIPTSSSLQAANLSALAKLVGIPVIGDFRSGDIALGGQGAPLVPVFDFDFLASSEINRILLNIGGISNLTYLPKNCTKEHISAFDCGPGNALLDSAANYFFGIQYDKDGAIAASGSVDSELLKILLTDDFVGMAPPKSTGRERYNLPFLTDRLKSLNRDIRPEDILRTLTEFSAIAVEVNIRSHCSPDSEIFVTGGGRENQLLMELIRTKIPEAKFRNIEEFGIPSDAKEAIAFAYLGYLFAKGRFGNIPSVTGASAETVLGILAV